MGLIQVIPKLKHLLKTVSNSSILYKLGSTSKYISRCPNLMTNIFNQQNQTFAFHFKYSF